MQSTIILVCIGVRLWLALLVFFDNPYVIFNLFCRSIFFYFYFIIIKNPILKDTFNNLGELNIFNIIVLLIVSMLSTSIGSKLFNWLKKVVLNLYNTFNNNSSNNTSLQANSGGILALAALANPSVASIFHAKKAISLKQEENNLATVLQKLDKEQPLPSGRSRWTSFQEYIGELRVDRFNSEKFAYRNYYRDVVMKEMKEIFQDTSSVSSVASTVMSNIF